ncbi:MAG: hypothetical protein CMH54_09865 [Myxococcales bacterium]|nr:hypothetical protein [Myxococcales bacterium]
MRQLLFSVLLVSGFAGFAVQASAHAPYSTPTETKATATNWTVSGLFQSVLHARNDSDFDASPRFFDPDGQTEGQMASFFRPGFSFRSDKNVSVHYELELGWNSWSRNSSELPNQYFEGGYEGLLLRHRQLWAGYTSAAGVELRVGYQRMVDPSRLWLDHLGGAVQVGFGDDQHQTTVFVGQLPDSTLEGIAVRDDNFQTDSFVGGVVRACRHGDWTLDYGVYGLLDRRSLDRPLQLGTGLVGVRYAKNTYRAWAHGLAQYGSWSDSGVAGTDQTVLSWAAQVGVSNRSGRLRWSTNAFALSPDDSVDGNDRLGAFWGSAKNNSASMMLTEDETRDRYDNLDERVSTQWGSLFFNRAGIAVVDAQVGYEVHPGAEMALLVAAGFNLEPSNALGHRFLGLELGLLNHFRLSEGAEIFLHLQFVQPGEAASVFVNEVDRVATEMQYGGKLGFAAQF